MNKQFVQGDAIFARTNSINQKYEYLSENIECDVIVVGGGVTGAILGYYFSKKNVNTVILEKNITAYGSTSITTSLLQYELDSTARDLEQYTSLENVIVSYKLGIKALDEISEFINKYGNKCDYEKRDALLYTARKSDIKEIEEEFKIRKEHGFNVKFLNKENNPYDFDLEAGVYSENGGAQLDPYRFTHQLLEAGVEQGLRIYENTEVIHINYAEDYVEAEVNYGFKVKGKIIIAATGYDTELFTNRNFGVKTTTFNVATKVLENIEKEYPLIRDNKDPYNYFRMTKDKRIIGGGQDVSFIPGIFNEKLAEEKYSIIESNIKKMFNKIDNIEIEYKYCGAFASTQDNLGFIGKDPDNEKLWYNLGYGANGILFAILGGMMLSELYEGKESKYLELFKVDRFDN